MHVFSLTDGFLFVSWKVSKQSLNYL